MTGPTGGAAAASDHDLHRLGELVDEAGHLRFDLHSADRIGIATVDRPWLDGADGNPACAHDLLLRVGW